MRVPDFLRFRGRDRSAYVPLPGEVHGAAEVFGDMTPGSGIHPLERDVEGAFCWTRRRFTLSVPTDTRFWSLRLCYPASGERVVIRDRRGTEVRLPLREGWHTYALDLSPCEGERLDCEVSRTVPAAGDPRELGVRIRRIARLRHAEDCHAYARVIENRTVNEREFNSGAVRLASYPPVVRVAVETRCNIKPRCVYCDWEKAKLDEAESDFRFSRASLAEMGAFYGNAEEISELGYGEPPMSPEFATLVEEFSRAGKAFSFACNGQILGPAVRPPLLGRNIQLFVSIDGARAETYARYRNEAFDLVIANVSALCAEKKAHRNLPHVTASFVAMRSNVDEFDAFVALMKQVGVDAVRVMGLEAHSRLLQRAERRGGAQYDYARERLSFEELEQFVAAGRAAAGRRGMPFYAVTDFGPHPGGGRPLCDEPWRAMNVLNRGIVVCCHNKSDRLAEWSQRGDRTVEQFLSDVWNGPVYLELRAMLGRGELPPICRTAGNCPIVARHLRSDAGSASAAHTSSDAPR
jgi:MoaA/NifB/PqqE/SkfB family radical SAM enzyme